jgi:hypothetical protein
MKTSQLQETILNLHGVWPIFYYQCYLGTMIANIMIRHVCDPSGYPIDDGCDGGQIKSHKYKSCITHITNITNMQQFALNFANRTQYT